MMSQTTGLELATLILIGGSLVMAGLIALTRWRERAAKSPTSSGR